MRPSKKSGSGKRSLPALTTSSMSWCTRGAMGRRRSSVWSRTEAPYRGRGKLHTRVRGRGILRSPFFEHSLGFEAGNTDCSNVPRRYPSHIAPAIGAIQVDVQTPAKVQHLCGLRTRIEKSHALSPSTSVRFVSLGGSQRPLFFVHPNLRTALHMVGTETLSPCSLSHSSQWRSRVA